VAKVAEDLKKGTRELDDVQVNYPRVRLSKFIVITADDKPAKNRTETQFFTPRNITGIVCPYNDLPQKYLTAIMNIQLFAGIPPSERGNFYAILEGDKPPDTIVSLLFFLVPAFFIFFGAFLLLYEKSSQAYTGAGKKRARKGSRKGKRRPTKRSKRIAIAKHGAVEQAEGQVEAKEQTEEQIEAVEAENEENETDK